MKKVFLVILIIIVAFATCACGEKDLGIDCSWDDGGYLSTADASGNVVNGSNGQKISINAKVEKSTITLISEGNTITGKIKGDAQKNNVGSGLHIENAEITWNGDINHFLGFDEVLIDEKTASLECYPNITMLISFPIIHDSVQEKLYLQLMYLMS